ncbi:Fc.00g041850.m01.CDS01 [Cosmosporella sp. VM-42]
MAIAVGVQALIVLIAATASICVGKVVYNVFFHPLRKFPGPLICRATPLYRHYKFLKGDLLYAVKSMHDTYGPVVRVTPNELSFISPESWKEIYLPLGGSKGEMARYDRFYHFAGPNAPETLVTLDKGYHAMLRRALAPAFSENTLRKQEPIMQEYVDLLIQKLVEDSKNGTQVVNLREWFNYYTFDMIGNLGFGSDFNGLKNSEYHPWVKAVTKHVKEFSFLQVLMYLGFPSVVHFLANSSLLKGKVLHEHLTKQKLEARMRVEKDRPDLLDPLLRLKPQPSFEQLLANASQLITAGSESSSTLLVATVSLLADNPAALEKVTEEIRSSFQSEDQITFTSTNNLPYLYACLNECLRRFPAVPPGLPRVVPPGGATVSGHALPEGTNQDKTVCTVASWASYHSEDHFLEPFGFHPERFLKDPKFANDRLDAFQPFGVGSTSCPGRNLAFAETRLAMARILYNFDIKSSPDCVNWTARQKSYLLWDKEPFWAYMKPVRPLIV